MSEINSSLVCGTRDQNMGFWTILGNIAAQIAMRTADAMFNRGGGDKGTPPATQMVAQPNWTNVVGACDGIYNRGVPPIDAIGNMRQSLYEQDPKVLRLALKVLESVVEERGIPASNDREAAEFLRGMRELLRDTRDRDVMDGVFELNDAWSRACRNSPAFRGVGDLVEMLNSEGYKVVVTRDKRRMINENAESTHCNSCDFQLYFDQLKHFCQYCSKIFCSNCCSYQRGIPPFQENSPVCICHECKAKNNSNFSPQQETSDTQTTPKDYNSIWNSSPERSGLQNVRIGNVSNNEEDVQINLVVPRHVAEDPEGLTISVQCKKIENSTSEVTARTEKKDNDDLKLTDMCSKVKLLEKDVWQDNSDSKKIVTKSSMETKNKNLLSEHQRYETRQEEEEGAACQLNNSKAETEDEGLKLALERSKESQMEDQQVQLALEISRRELENKESKERSASESENDDEDSEEGDTYSKKPTCCCKHGKDNWEEEEALQRALKLSLMEVKQACYNCGKEECECDEGDTILRAMEISRQESANRQERSASESDNDDEGSEEGNTYIKKPRPSYVRNRSQEDDNDTLIQATGEDFNSKLGKGGKTCCGTYGKDNWEEEEALELALKLSLEEVKQACYNCGKQECQCDEVDTLLRAVEISRQESANRQVCENCGKDECECEEGDVLRKAIELSRRESVNRELPPGDSSTTNLVLGKGSDVESTGKPPKEEELRQKRLKYFEKENAKERLESLGHCSGRCEMLHEEECHLSDAARQKIAIIEEEEMKLAIQLSLQEMRKNEKNSNEVSEEELNSSAEEDSIP